jgi:DNA-binding transcriptional MerR regulator
MVIQEDLHMELQEIVGLSRLAALVGVSERRIRYAETKGKLPEPRRWEGRAVYASEDVERVREFFRDRPHFSR